MLANNLSLDEEDAVQAELLALQTAVVRPIHFITLSLVLSFANSWRKPNLGGMYTYRQRRLPSL